MYFEITSQKPYKKGRQAKKRAQIAAICLLSIFQISPKATRLEGRNIFLEATTLGDGDCFFHAAFGENIDGNFIALKADKMRKEWHTFLSCYKSLLDDSMPENLRSQLYNIFSSFFENISQERPIELLKEKYVAIISDMTLAKKKSELACLNAKELIKYYCEKYQNISAFEEKVNAKFGVSATLNPQQINSKISEELKDLYEIGSISGVNKLEDKGVAFEDKYDSQKSIRDVCCQEIFYQAYLNAIQSKDYYILSEEIPILVSISGARICLNVEGDEGGVHYIPSPLMLPTGYKPNSDIWPRTQSEIEEEINILHRDIHYSRLLKLSQEDLFLMHLRKALSSGGSLNIEEVNPSGFMNFVGDILGGLKKHTTEEVEEYVSENSKEDSQRILDELLKLNPERKDYIQYSISPLLEDAWLSYESEIKFYRKENEKEKKEEKQTEEEKRREELAKELGPINSWDKIKIKTWRSMLAELNLPEKKKMAQTLAVGIRACEIVYGYQPRATQLVSVLSCLLSKSKGEFLQVRTGEGKSLITALLAAVHNIVFEDPIDIISSSGELAARDAQEQQEFFRVLGLSCGFLDQKASLEMKYANYAYNDILYSDISYLMGDTLYELCKVRNIRVMDLEINGSPRYLKRNYAALIIDELDSSLIDCITTILRTDQSIPGSGTLIPILALIWIRIINLNKHIVFNKEQNEWIYAPSDFLIDNKDEFIRRNLIQFCNELLEDSHKEFDLPIADNLKSFAFYQIPQWVASAMASFDTQEDTDYIYKHNDDVEPGSVKIVDRVHTGVVQEKLEWGSGKHQFVTIKHGGRIYPESSVGAYISRVAFLSLYGNNIYGMTGTLGDEATRSFLKRQYPVNLINIPPYKRKRFEEYPGIVFEEEYEWQREIIENISNIAAKGRGVLVICDSIRECNFLASKLKVQKSHLKLKIYNRSDISDNKEAVARPIEPGEVILSTNLGGRGTDIAITKEVEEKGGLHVIVTFVPLNKRVEEQAFGRSARKGQPGSGQLIAHDPLGQTIEELRRRRDNREEMRLQSISNKLKEQKLHDDIFRKVNDYMRDLRKKSPEKLKHIIGNAYKSHNCEDEDKLDQLAFLWCMLYHRIEHYKSSIYQRYQDNFQDALDKKGVELSVVGEIRSWDQLLDAIGLTEKGKHLFVLSWFKERHGCNLKEAVKKDFDLQNPGEAVFRALANVSGRAVFVFDHNGDAKIYPGWRDGLFLCLGSGNLKGCYEEYIYDLNVLKDFYPELDGQRKRIPKKVQINNPFYLLSHKKKDPAKILQEVAHYNDSVPEEFKFASQFIEANEDEIKKAIELRKVFAQEDFDEAHEAESEFLHHWVNDFVRDIKKLYPEDEKFLFISRYLIARAKNGNVRNPVACYERAMETDQETCGVQGYNEWVRYHLDGSGRPSEKVIKNMVECCNRLNLLIERWMRIKLFMGDEVETKAVALQIEQRIEAFTRMREIVKNNIETVTKPMKDGDRILPSGGNQYQILSILSTKKEGFVAENVSDWNKDQIEMAESGLLDFESYHIKRKKRSFWSRIGMAFIGIVQVVVGAFTGGAGYAIGVPLMMSGFQDIWHAAKSFVTGTLSWTSFWMRKGLQALTCAISHVYGMAKNAIMGPPANAAASGAKTMAHATAVEAATAEAANPGIAAVTKEAFFRTVVDAGKKAFVSTLLSEVKTKAAKEIIHTFEEDLKEEIANKINPLINSYSNVIRSSVCVVKLGLGRGIFEFEKSINAFSAETHQSISQIISDITEACIKTHHSPGVLGAVIGYMMDGIGYVRYKEKAKEFVENFASKVESALKILQLSITPLDKFLAEVYMKRNKEELSEAEAKGVISTLIAKNALKNNRAYFQEDSIGKKYEEIEITEKDSEESLKQKNYPIEAINQSVIDNIASDAKKVALWNTLLCLFDFLNHASCDSVNELENIREVVLNIGTRGLMQRKERAIHCLTSIGMEATRDLMRGFRAEMNKIEAKEKLQEEEAKKEAQIEKEKIELEERIKQLKEASQTEAKTIWEDPQTNSEEKIELGRYIEELKAALEVSYGDEIIQFANSDAQYIPFTSLQMENDPDLISQINELKDSFAHSDSSATEDFKPQIQTKSLETKDFSSEANNKTKSLEAESIREILDKLPASSSDDGKTNIEYLNEVLYNKREEEPTWAVSAQKSAVLDLIKTSNQVVGTGIRATFYARAVYTSVPFGPLGGSIRFLIQAAIFEGGCLLGSYPVGWVRTGVEKVAASTGTSEQDAVARADLAGTAFDTTLNIAGAKILFGKPRFVENLKGADRVNGCLLKLDEFLKKGGSIEALEAAGVKTGRIMELINEGSRRLIEGEIFGMQPELAVEAAGGGFGFKRGFLLPKAKGKVAGGVRSTEGIAGEARAGESGSSISYSKRHDSGPSKPTASSSSGKSPEVGLESSIERVRANPNLLRNYARLIEESTDAKIPEVQFNMLKENLRAEGYTKISKDDWAASRVRFKAMQNKLREEWAEKFLGDKNAWPKEKRLVRGDWEIHSIEAHHIIPLEFGGPNVWWNIIPVKHIKHRGKDGLHYNQDFIKLFGKPGERK